MEDRKRTHNDAEREEWITTTLEGFYHDQRRSRMSMRAYIRANREEIDAAMDAVLDTEPSR
jgi:hypothetical protein